MMFSLIPFHEPSADFPKNILMIPLTKGAITNPRDPRILGHELGKLQLLTFFLLAPSERCSKAGRLPAEVPLLGPGKNIEA